MAPSMKTSRLRNRYAAVDLEHRGENFEQHCGRKDYFIPGPDE